MRAILVIVIVAFGLIAAAQNRFNGLLLYLWFSFFRPQEWAYSTIVDLRLSLLAGVALVGPSALSGKFPNVRHPLCFGSLMFLGTACIAHFNAVSPSLSLGALDQLARVIVVSLLTVTLVTSRREFVLVLLTVVASLGFHSSKYGVGYLIRGGAHFRNGIGGMFSDNNDFALAIARIIFLTIPCAQNIEGLVPFGKWVRRGLWVTLPLSMVAVISTYSRGGALAMAGGFLTFIMLQKRRFTVLAVIGILAVVGYLVVPVPDDYMNRLGTIANYDTAESMDRGLVTTGDESALSRLHFWQVAMVMAEANPFGVGLRNFERNYDRYDFSQGDHGTRKAVHSSHFQVLAETGYLGLLIWFGLIFWSVKTLLQIRSRSSSPQLSDDAKYFYLTSANGMLASMVAFMIGASFLSQLLNDLNWLGFGLIATLDRLSLAEVGATVKEPVAAPMARPVPAFSGFSAMTRHRNES